MPNVSPFSASANAAILSAGSVSDAELTELLALGTTATGAATDELKAFVARYRDAFSPEATELLREREAALGVKVDAPPALLSAPSLKAVIGGTKTLSMSHNRKDPAVAIVQRALMRAAMLEGRADFTLPKFGADGDLGSETTAALKAFQTANGLTANGVVNAATINALDLTLKGRSSELQSVRFEDVQLLQDILDAKLPALGKGSKGEAVKRVQQALLDLGYPLPSGVDGAFGNETLYALRQFQDDHGLAKTAKIDAQTLAELEHVAPEAGARAVLHPEYAKMVKNGTLSVTLGVGYDETGADLPVRTQLLGGLAARGYKKLEVAGLSAAELLAQGVDPAQVDKAGTYYALKTQQDGKPVTVLLKWIDRNTTDHKARFIAGMASSALVLYAGHARYGSGPDFDDKESAAGNVVIGANAAGHKTGALTPAYDAHMRSIIKDVGNDLEAMSLTSDYQMMFFAGCTTRHYLDELRVLAKGKDQRNLDTITSNDILYWHVMPTNIFTMLDGVLAKRSKNELEDALFAANDVSFTFDGFAGNTKLT